MTGGIERKRAGDENCLPYKGLPTGVLIGRVHWWTWKILCQQYMTPVLGRVDFGVFSEEKGVRESIRQSEKGINRPVLKLPPPLLPWKVGRRTRRRQSIKSANKPSTLAFTGSLVGKCAGLN